MASAMMLGGSMAGARVAAPAPRRPRAAAAPAAGRRDAARMGNSNPNGLFAPIVRLTANIMGRKKFNSFRGKIIAKHSNVIGAFCTTMGADNQMKKGLIKLAKDNGGELGFLA